MHAFFSTPKVVEEKAGGLQLVDKDKEFASKFMSNSAPQKDPNTSAIITDEIFTGYISDVEEDVDKEIEGTLQVRVTVRDAEDHAEIEGSGNASHTSNVTHKNLEWEDVFEGAFHVPNTPPLK